MKYVVMYSGGISSFISALAVVKKFGKENVTCIFADTLIEDATLYKFVDDTIKYMGCNFVRLCDGRTPWEVFRDVKYIGNTRVDPCSKILKRDICDNYLLDNFDPKDTTVILGLDWTEMHRVDSARNRYKEKLGFNCAFPLVNPPYMTKSEMISFLKTIDIEIPKLYKLNFSHNNCGGFCVRGGLAHFELLLKELPEVFDKNADEEEKTMEHIGKRVPFLRKRVDGKVHYITMKEFKHMA